jgi:hypothetical protein
MNAKELKDYGIDIAKAKLEINRIRIDSELIQELEKEYQLQAEMVNPYLEKLKNPKKNK